MEQSVQELCWLIQEVLYEKKHDFTITDSERLFQIAKENGLSGTVFEVIKKHGVTEEVYQKFQKEFYLYVAQDEEHNRMIELIKGLLNSYNIKHLFLKGSELKNIYPQSYMRPMGDIDFLIQEKDKSEVHERLERVGIKLKSRGFVHDYYETDSGVKVEVHTRLVKEENEFSDLERIEDIVLNKDRLELTILYLLYHLKKHLITSGIGLRSVLDIGIYIHHMYDEIDVEKLHTLLQNNNLEQLFVNVMLFNSRYLDEISFLQFAMDQEVNESLFESFTNYIILSGIHGWGISFNHYSGIISITKNNQKFRRVRYLFKITFFPYKDLKYLYPRLLKTRLLLPIAWVFRIFNLLFKDRLRRKKRLVQLFDQDINNYDVSYMFEELGI